MGDLRIEQGKDELVKTRKMVDRKWKIASDILEAQDHVDLAADIRTFVREMPPPQTDKEQIAAELLARTKVPPSKDHPPMAR